MAKYKIKGTNILHNKKLYPEGTVIDLTEKQAEVLADYLEVMREIKKQQPKSVKAAQKKTETAKTASEKSSEVVEEANKEAK